MGKFRDLLNSAKHNNSEAVMELYKRCQPTIKKYSYVNGKFDEGRCPLCSQRRSSRAASVKRRW